MGEWVGLNASFLALGTLAALTTVTSMWLWPRDDPAEVPHAHRDMPASHSHLQTPAVDGHGRHSHAYVIDDEHQRWPRD